ncbi:MAG: hypothetical protein KDD67_17745 [Ignavibacteriae bacterium]|nr:hypothetical protein [Ignavibacteriota bacterium]MCB9214645.1 hypothetical protein [Ignavibacteria bacterium]
MNLFERQLRVQRGYGLLFLSAFLLLAGGVTELSAQMKNRHVQSWELLTPKLSGKRGETVYAKIRFTLTPKAHLYTTMKYEGEGPNPTEITFDTSFVQLNGAIESSSKPILHFDPNFSVNSDSVYTEYWEGTVTLTIPLKIAKNAKRGKRTSWVNILFMTCDDKVCIPPMDQRFEIEFNVKKG